MEKIIISKDAYTLMFIAELNSQDMESTYMPFKR